MQDGIQPRRFRGDEIKCITMDSGKVMDRESFEGVVHILAEWCYRAYRRDHPEVDRSRVTPVPVPASGLKPVAKGRLLSVDGLAEYLSIPKATIYSWNCMRKFPPKAVVRLGRSLRFDVKEIDAWVEENRSRERHF